MEALYQYIMYYSFEISFGKEAVLIFCSVKSFFCPILIPQLMVFAGIKLLLVLNTLLVMVGLIMESMRITLSLMNMDC